MPLEHVNQLVSEVRESLASLGVHVLQAWLAQCLGSTNTGSSLIENGGDRRRSCERTQEHIYKVFLACDLREAGAACLPPGVANMTKEQIRRRMVLQVEAARDVAKTLEQRREADGKSSHHTLKLALGDGRQTVTAFEYRRIQGLPADPPPGLKVLVIEPWVRRGILLLTPDNAIVLGGEVASLVKARDEARSRRDKAREGRQNTPMGGPVSSQASAPAATGRGEHEAAGGGRGDRGRAGQGPGPRNLGTPNAQPSSQAPSRREALDVENSEALALAVENSNGARSTRLPAVVNPYGGSMAAAVIHSPRRAASQSEQPGSQESEREAGSKGRKRKLERRVPAFRDEDDGPPFEYLEEEDEEEEHGGILGEQQPQPPPEVDVVGSSAQPAVSSAPPLDRLPPSPADAAPRVITAREQRKRMRIGALEAGHAEGDVAMDAGAGCEVVGDSGRISTGVSLTGKRGRSDSSGQGGEPESEALLYSPPPGPYTSLLELESAAGTSGGVHRVKAVVADTVACKIRKRAYRLIIDIEDGTAVMRVRLCESIGKRLFGLDAREYRKIFQADPHGAQGIQSRVENDIRQMEGVMELDMAPATTLTPSPSAPEALSGNMTQGSQALDPELSLPVVMSVTPPTLDDCRGLLARVERL